MAISKLDLGIEDINKQIKALVRSLPSSLFFSRAPRAGIEGGCDR